VVLQTRRGDDPVIRALEQGDFDAIVSDDIATAKLLALPPYGGVATISGEAAEEFASLLGQSSVSVYQVPEGFVVRARDVDALTLALRSVSRPAGKLRVAVQ
jgi:primosomal protein N'